MSSKAGFWMMCGGLLVSVLLEMQFAVPKVLFLAALVVALVGLWFWLRDADLLGDGDE